MDTVAVLMLQTGTATSPLVSFLRDLWPAAIAFIGTFLGYWLATRQAKDQRVHDHLRERITLLYAPVVGTLKQIQALTHARAEFSRVSATEWRERLTRP